MSGADVPVDTERKQNPGRIFHGRKQRENEPEMIKRRDGSMKETEPVIREMTMDDFEAVHALWMEIHGFGIRSIDDSREGVERFIRRNPTTSMVAVAEGKIVGAILCGEAACIMYACRRRTASTGSDRNLWVPAWMRLRQSISTRSI